MKKTTIIAALACAAALTGTRGALAQSYYPILGEIRTFATTFCPVDFLPTDGQILQIRSNTPLYSLLGNRFGGSFREGTFALPTIKPDFTVDEVPLLSCIAIDGLFPLRP
jgi:hypothetical protein